MSKIKKELATKCELALMGKVIPCNNDEVQAMTDYIITVLRASNEYLDEEKDILSKINQYSEQGRELQVKYLVCNTIMGEFNCITFLLDDDGEPEPLDLANHEDVFCYVYNVTDPMLSELGYCYFEKKQDHFYHRVGQC